MHRIVTPFEFIESSFRSALDQRGKLFKKPVQQRFEQLADPWNPNDVFDFFLKSLLSTFQQAQ